MTTNYLTRKNTDEKGIIDILGGREWLEMCVGRVTITKEDELFKNTVILLDEVIMRNGLEEKHINPGVTFRVKYNRTRKISPTKSVGTFVIYAYQFVRFRYNGKIRIGLYHLDNNVPGVIDCSTPQQVINAFEVYTKSRIFLGGQ